jgi:Ca2+/H+ antiporter, TMEM165/GDT1 family
LADFTLASFGAVAATIFVAELTDKDAFLLLTLSTRMRARIAFLAGASAFILTTGLFVTLGSLLIEFVPVYWVRMAGGVAMLAYGLWEARGLVGARAVEEEGSRIQRQTAAWKSFLATVGALALLDIAGDATEILTIVFVAHYQNAFLVFAGAAVALVCATAIETALGNRLGRVLTPKRLRYLSTVVFLALGSFIILLNLA